MIPNNTHWLIGIAVSSSIHSQSGTNPTPTTQPFIGMMQSVQFNGQQVIEMAKSGQLPNAIVSQENFIYNFRF